MKSVDEAIVEGRAAAANRYQLELLASDLIEIAARSIDKYEAIQKGYWLGLAAGIRSGERRENVSSDIH